MVASKKYKNLATDVSATLAVKIKKQPEKFKCLWLIWHLPVQVPLDLLKISYKILSFYFKKSQKKSKQKNSALVHLLVKKQHKKYLKKKRGLENCKLITLGIALKNGFPPDFLIGFLAF